MNTETTWKIVEELEWPCSTRGLATWLHDTFTESELDSFDVRLHERVAELRAAIESHEVETGRELDIDENDFTDFIWHIVGEGRESFERCLDDPEYAIKRARRGDYTPSLWKVIFLAKSI